MLPVNQVVWRRPGGLVEERERSVGGGGWQFFICLVG